MSRPRRTRTPGERNVFVSIRVALDTGRSPLLYFTGILDSPALRHDSRAATQPHHPYPRYFPKARFHRVICWILDVHAFEGSIAAYTLQRVLRDLVR